MGGILGKSSAKQPTAVGALQYQTSQQGGVVPLVYGTTRVAPNLLNYGGFEAHQVQGSGKGKGGGSGKGTGQYDYTASIVWGLCQGPISGLGQVWWDNNIGTLSGTGGKGGQKILGAYPAGVFDPGGALYLGSDGQAPDNNWAAAFPDSAIGYSGTANIVTMNYDLGSSAAVPNSQFEVRSVFHDAPNQTDANPATIVADYLTNPRYGAGFPAANLDPGLLAGASPMAPVLGSAPGGSLAAATYYVRITYLTAAGETTASLDEASFAVAADALLTVAAPAAQGNATGWNVYAGAASGAETLQNAVPIAIGTPWTEPVSGLVAGAPPPAAGTADTESYWTYCHAAGIFLSPQLDQQQEAQQNLSDLTSLTNSAVVWSGGVLKIIPYGDLPLSAKYTVLAMTGNVGTGETINVVFSNPALPGGAYTIGYLTPGASTVNTVATALDVAVNGDPVLANFGIRAFCGGNILTIVEQPPQGTGIALTSTGGETIDTYVVGTWSWQPVATVRYALGEDDFIVQESNVGTGQGVVPGGPALRQGAGPITGGFTDDPVHVQRSTPADANNMVQVQFNDRGQNYDSMVCEAFDQAAIDLYGIRRDTSLKATAVACWATAQAVAQLGLQRQLLYRNTYTFQLGWKYCLLEPMDLVAIGDARLGLSNQIVRITAIAEDAEGTLSVTAEDFVPGWATAKFYPSPAAAGFVPNYSALPGPVSPPVIFEPPAALLSGDLEIWVALSGGANWGGAQVWLSSDGESYAFAGTVEAPAVMGATTADLPNYAGSSPDGVISPATAPATGIAGGGSRPGTYYAAFSYTDAAGETFASPASPGQAVGTGQLLVVDTPAAATNATGWNVYAGTPPTALTRQNSAPIAIGTNWTMPSGGLVAGSAEPTADTTGDILAVDLSESFGALTSVSPANAALGVTLCWVDGELIAYETATLTAQYQYDLTTLYRGLYGSAVADHPSGSQFANIAGIGRFPYPSSLVGQEIYLKFLSFNLVGNALQQLSDADVTAYAYTVTGGGRPTGNFSVAGFYNGTPAASAVLQRYVFAETVTFPSGLGGSVGHAGTAPGTNAIAISIDKNGTTAGTMNFAIGGTTATFAMTAATTFNAGDVLSLVMPNPADTGFANLSWTLLGNA